MKTSSIQKPVWRHHFNREHHLGRSSGTPITADVMGEIQVLTLEELFTEYQKYWINYMPKLCKLEFILNYYHLIINKVSLGLLPVPSLNSSHCLNWEKVCFSFN